MAENGQPDWSSDEGEVVAAEVMARLMSGRTLDDLVLPRYEGRVDLRGFRLPAPRRLDRYERAGWFVESLGGLFKLRRVEVEGVDLTDAFLPSLRWTDSQIIGCRFGGAYCQDWRLWGTRIEHCDFAGADLRGAAVGTWDRGRRNEWSHICFAKTDFRVGVSWKALYEDCDFSKAILSKVAFEQCDFIRCRFTGRLRQVVFDGNEHPERPAGSPMIDVDFSEAVFSDVEFYGYDLAGTVMPDDEDTRCIPRYVVVVDRALALLEGDESREARVLRAEFTERVRRRGHETDSHVFNRRDYQRSGGEVLAQLADTVLRRAQAATE